MKVDVGKKYKGNNNNKPAGRPRLVELQEKLEFATTRCNSLNQQLKAIKALYQTKDKDKFAYLHPAAWNGAEPQETKAPLTITMTRKEQPKSKKQHRQKKTRSIRSKDKWSKSGSTSCTCTSMSTKDSQTEGTPWQQDVVELFKNNAINVDTDSARHANPTTKPYLLIKDKSKSPNTDTVVGDSKLLQFGCFEKEAVQEAKEQSPVFTKVELSTPSYGFHKETIASSCKKKDGLLTNIKVHRIPFCAATSTTPSHNINVNIQQVHSILKQKKGLSQTTLKDLAYEDQFAERPAPKKSSLSFWQSEEEKVEEKEVLSYVDKTEAVDVDWDCKVSKLKKVLLNLHEEFTQLNQKYRRVQKKIAKKTVNKEEAKYELKEIEDALGRKEDEITVVVELYQEIIKLKTELNQLQEPSALTICGRPVPHSAATAAAGNKVPMVILLRSIQHFQDMLKR